MKFTQGGQKGKRTKKKSKDKERKDGTVADKKGCVQQNPVWAWDS